MNYVRYLWFVTGIFFVSIIQVSDDKSHATTVTDFSSLFWLSKTAEVVALKINAISDAALRDQMFNECRTIRNQYNTDLDGAHRAYFEMNRRVSTALLQQRFDEVAVRENGTVNEIIVNSTKR